MSCRKGINLLEITRCFGTEEKAEAWFIEQRWPNGVACPKCGSLNIATVANRKPAPFRCRDCRKHFSIKTGTVLHSSNISLDKWAIAFYLYMTNLKGVSSMKLHRDLGITQKSAWHMAHRIRETLAVTANKFAGPVEVDETYIGGKERNKHNAKKLRAGRGPVGKTAVVGMKDRKTGQIASQVVEHTDALTLLGFVERNTEPDAMVYTDDARAYQGLPRPHEAVKHSVSEYVRGMAHTNGMESHWAALKRGYDGVCHHMSAKHLPRYVVEFEGRHNRRPLDTTDQMAVMAKGADGKQLRYLVALGADTLIMSDRAELGPLDTQVEKPDEIGGRHSGIVVVQALKTLQEDAFRLFEDYFLKLRTRSGLRITTRTAADMAFAMNTGLFGPIYGQIDPLSPNPPKDTDGRREDSGRGWVRELQGRWPGVLG